MISRLRWDIVDLRIPLFDYNQVPTDARGKRSLAQGRLKDKIVKDSWKAAQRNHRRRR